VGAGSAGGFAGVTWWCMERFENVKILKNLKIRRGRSLVQKILKNLKKTDLGFK
jgi:hypothetical protein